MDKKDSRKEIYATQVRLPQALADRIKAGAESNHRSFNSELIVLLEIALENGGERLAASIVPADWRSGKKRTSEQK